MRPDGLKRYTQIFHLKPAETILCFFNCFWRERESEHASMSRVKSRGRETGTEVERQKRREGERERENLKQAPCSVQSPKWGSIPQPWNHDLS